MNYNKDSRVLKISGSELMSLYSLFVSEDIIKIMFSLRKVLEDYPFVLDSKSKIEIEFTDIGHKSTYIKSTYGCKNER